MLIFVFVRLTFERISNESHAHIRTSRCLDEGYVRRLLLLPLHLFLQLRLLDVAGRFRSQGGGRQLDPRLTSSSSIDVLRHSGASCLSTFASSLVSSSAPLSFILTAVFAITSDVDDAYANVPLSLSCHSAIYPPFVVATSAPL